MLQIPSASASVAGRIVGTVASYILREQIQPFACFGALCLLRQSRLCVAIHEVLPIRLAPERLRPRPMLYREARIRGKEFRGFGSSLLHSSKAREAGR